MAQILAYTENFLPNYRNFSNQNTRVYRNIQIYSCEGPKGQPATLQPYVINAPLNRIKKRFTYAMTNSNIHSTFFLRATAHLTNNTIVKIIWKNDEPVWTEQWPLKKEKLQAAKKLIDTQLELKHIEDLVSLELSYFCYKK